MPLYSPNSVERIVIELTANCNAMCPGCDRWNKGDGGLNAVVEQHLGRAGHMTLRKFNNAIHNDLFLHHPEFRTIEFNGSVGDAILHPLFINFIKLVNKKNDQFRKENSKENPRVRLKLATNAGLHGKKFWTEVAKQFIASGRHQNHLIMVALDGTTNETHQQYRRGVDFNKALTNARTLIDNGAKVRWQFIEFAHNKHQIEEAKELAKKYGFQDIEVRNSRGENSIYGDWVSSIKEAKAYQAPKIELLKKDAKVEKPQKTRVEKKINTKLERKIEYKVTPELEELIKETEKIKDVEKFINETPIYCDWGNKGSINIEFNGTVHPCCHMNQGMFYPNNDKNKYYHEVNALYDSGWNNLENYNLVQILNHTYFKKDLEDSWKPDTDPDKKFKRLTPCLELCSRKRKDNDEVTDIS